MGSAGTTAGRIARFLAMATVGASVAGITPAAAQTRWETMPRMALEGQFAGPLRDTIIQRLRDPLDGAVCYVYLPITAPHTMPVDNGFVQYGPNTIGSISCIPGAPPAEGPPAPMESPAE